MNLKYDLHGLLTFEIDIFVILFPFGDFRRLPVVEWRMVCRHLFGR